MKKQNHITKNKELKINQKSKILLNIDIYKIIKQFLCAKIESQNMVEYNHQRFNNCEEIVNRILRSYDVPIKRVYISEKALIELNE